MTDVASFAVFAILGAFWVLLLWRVRVERGDVGVTDLARARLRFKVALIRFMWQLEPVAAAIWTFGESLRRWNVLVDAPDGDAPDRS